MNHSSLSESLRFILLSGSSSMNFIKNSQSLGESTDRLFWSLNLKFLFYLSTSSNLLPDIKSFPDRIKYIMHPILKMSDYLSYFIFLNISGAMNPGVPQIESKNFFSSVNFPLRPKSAILIYSPALVFYIKILSGFMSRWTYPNKCNCFTLTNN